MPTVLLANDHAGIALRAVAIETLRHLGYAVIDLGTTEPASVDYPDFAHTLAQRLVSDPNHAFGVLICGSGIGMSIAANRHPGVRAVVCSEGYSAAMARKHNAANVLCFGARVVGAGVAEQIITAFATATFEGGRHESRVKKIERP